MGLDQYAYAMRPDKLEKKINFFTWRKHHDLHGWMENRWRAQGGEGEFNVVDFQLKEYDLTELRNAIFNSELPHTEGFFFGNNPPNEESNKNDYQFIELAFQKLQEGYDVFYTSWW